jgi:hypothetical protein
MNVRGRRSSFSPPPWLTLNRSSRNPGYEAAESRRSPRDRSPGRYNDPRDSDQYRGGGFRGNGERRRSIPDARSNNHSAFQANRELFTEPTRREAARDFPPRDIPRGPKASVGHERSAPHDRSLPHEAPTGPRASIGSHDFRADSNYRGDFGFRGSRGRGRGRGHWPREESRDRVSRDADRGDFRDRDRRSDERGPPPFRDDRGRDRERWDSRDQRDTFRGRRPSSPQGRGRSPNHGSRDTRDPPSNLDLDRTHRAARDVPSSTVSPSGDVSQPFGRGGYGRGRGARGRGRGFYDDYRGPPSIRSRSPEPFNINRRTLQSATPPPQVPAYGSTVAKISTPITSSQIVPPATFHSAPIAPAIPTTTTSLPPTVPKGPRVPVAPSARQPYPQGLHRPASSTWVRPPERPSPELRSREDDLFPNYAPSKDDASAHETISNYDNASAHEEAASVTSNAQQKPSSEPQSARSPPREELKPKKRFPCIGRRQPTIPSPVPEDSDDNSDSEEELNDNYFEGEIARVKADIAQVEASNPLLPPVAPIIASDWRPFIEPIIDNVIPDPCISSTTQAEQKSDQAKEPATIPTALETAPKSISDDIVPTLSTLAPESEADNKSADIRALVTASVRHDEHELAQSTATHPEAPSISEDVGMSDEVTGPPALVAPPSNLASGDYLNRPIEGSPIAAAAPLPFPNGHSQTPHEPGVVSPNDVFPMPMGEMARSSEDVKSNDLMLGTNGHHTMDVDEPENLPKLIQPSANGFQVKRPMMDENEGSDGSQDEHEREEELEAVRRMMKTPPVSSLPKSTAGNFWDNTGVFADLEIRHVQTEKHVKRHINITKDRRDSINENEGQAWAQRYETYRRFTDYSADPDAVRSREKFAASRAKAAAEAAAPHISSVASASAKPEGRRGRFATESDFQRVLKESEAEAREKEQDERLARAKTASAKEATIPAMCDQQWWSENGFMDMSHRVPFKRSFALLEYGEPIDNFTPEESEIFEKVYLETPKNWSRVAEALDHRDFKACIQHYYLVKHSAKLKDKASSKKKKKGRGPAKRPKANAMSAMVENNDNADDDQENETGGSKRRPRRAAAPTFPIDAQASVPTESDVGTPVPTPGRKSVAAPKTENGTEPGPAKKKVKVSRESKKQAKSNQLLAAAPMAAGVTRRDDSPITPVPPPIPLETKLARNSVAQNRYLPQFDGPSSTTQAIQPQPTFTPPVSTFVPAPVPAERQPPSVTGTFEIMSQPHLSPQPHTPQQQPLSYPSQERAGSTTPLSFDMSQASRNNQQPPSSYWSVPEQNDFPALLRHFGTDWQGIARHMTSKTHIMVYTTLFQQWLQVPSDSNKSRRVANILTQVKNFYQRKVDGGQRDWQDIARDADQKKERGESTGLAPTPSIIPKRRFDPSGSVPPRPGSAMDGTEGMVSPGPSSMMQAIRPSQASPLQQQHISTRFPALATAGPVPHIQPAAPTSIISKQLTPQSSNQSPAAQSQNRQRGPPLGYFTPNNAEPPTRPPLQPRNDSAASSRERTFQVAREAQLEQNAAIRLAQEQKEQRERERLQQHQEEQQQMIAHQKERDQRERELLEEQRNALQIEAQHKKRLKEQQEREQREAQRKEEQLIWLQRQKQEEAANQRALEAAAKFKEEMLDNSRLNLQQIEAYSTPNMRPNVIAHSRVETSNAPEVRRPLLEHQQTQFQSRPPQQPRRFVNENIKPASNHREIREREMQPSTAAAMHRPPPGAAPLRHEQQSMTPVAQPKPHHILQPHVPQQSPIPAHVNAVRQQDTVRKTSNIMSLLNDDPPEARPEPPKRVANMSATPQPPAQSHTPPPQHPLHANRFASHQPQPPTQPQAMAQQIQTQPAAHAQQPSHQQHNPHHAAHSPHPYAQAPPHPSHHHSSSIGHPRSYTPTGFDRRAYDQTPAPQQGQQQQQQMYSQPPPRQPMAPQPPIRREPSIGDIHGLSNEFSTRARDTQSSMRLKASPYTSTPPPASNQPTRQQVGSPLELSMPGERDFYSRQPQAQYLIQQPSAAPSPQLGPTYQQPSAQPPHRLAYSQSQSHAASPPPHFAGQQQHQPPPQHHQQHQHYRSRGNSIDGRDPRHPSTSSASTPSHSGYQQAPTHPAAHASMQYQPPPHDRYESSYEREQRRVHEEQQAAYHQRRLEESRR